MEEANMDGHDMDERSADLAGIKVQTARMVEIYALLRKELQQMPPDAFRPEDVQRLHAAIAQVETNMRELQKYLTATREASSGQDPEARELEQILDAVLAWARQGGE